MPTRRPLTAGPLTMELDTETGWLHHVRLGDREALRAVYPAVRDQFWNTLPNRVSELTVRSQGDGFEASFLVSCRQAEIDFVARCELTGSVEGGVTYRFAGEARSTFLRNRIGLCVLHPIEGCAGRPCDIEHTDGQHESNRFPAEVGPHQPFHDVRAITHEIVPGVSLEVRCEGDVFEAEDQRNWTDWSFKTYSTPLALPRPVKVAVGTTLHQTVSLTLIGRPAAAAMAIPTSPAERRLARLPQIGFGVTDRPLSSGEVRLLRPLLPDHLRLVLSPANSDAEPKLRLATEQALALDTRLEISLLLGDDVPADLQTVAGLVRDGQSPVCQWLLCRGLIGVAGAEELALARQALLPLTPNAGFGVGTNLYFTEFNRARPPLGEADAVTFSLNPQVHAFDDESLMETLAGQEAVAAAARRLVGSRRVHVGPITLRPRFNPNGETGSGPLSDPDPRQAQPLAAAWLLGSLCRLAAGGADSVTYFELAGPRGLCCDDSSTPALRLLAAVQAARSWASEVTDISRAHEIAGLLFRSSDRALALLANLTDRPVSVPIPVLQGNACSPWDVLADKSQPHQEGEPVRLRSYGVAGVESPPR
jgi:D-apionolactonase